MTNMNTTVEALTSEYRRFEQWLKQQTPEMWPTSDGRPRCTVHGKRQGSVAMIAGGYVQYQCYHCKLEEFRAVETGARDALTLTERGD